MERILKIEGSSNWPQIAFDANTGKLCITGRSIVENAIRFYEPIASWVKEYCKKPANLTELHLKLEYFNTSTSKYLLLIIEMLETLYSEGNMVKIIWYSADEDMAELGEDYDAMIDIPFQFVEFSA